jgi:hypothetical protein
MSDDIFLPLSKTLFTHTEKKGKSDFPPELLAIINTELRSTLTLRSLLNLCAACKRKPTAPMLAFALQNSIPCLTGLPMDNPDPGFYIEVAKHFYDKFAVFEGKVWLYRRVHNNRGRNEFFPPNVNLYGPLTQYRPSAMDYFVSSQISDIGDCVLATKEGRRLTREMMLEWRAHYEGKDPKYHDFIDRVVRILDHAFVLRVERKFISTGVV